MALPLSYPNYHTNISSSVVDMLVNTGVYIESTVPAFLHMRLHEVTQAILTPGQLTEETWSDLNSSFAKASERYLVKHIPVAADSAVSWANHVTKVLTELPHGQGYTPIIYAVGTTLTCVTGCFVAARFYSKKKLMNHLRIEDWIVLFCMFNGVAYSTLMQKSVELGGGTHIWDVTWNSQIFIMKCAFLCNFFYSTAVMSVKIALLCFYYRLSQLRGYRWAVLITMMFISMLYVATILTLAFSCKPIAYWTNPWEKKCINEKAFWMSTAIINMLTDVVTLLIPTPIVWKLELRKREKVGIILLFGLGLFACFASTLRILTLNGFFESTDFTYKEALTGLWGLVELDIAIICSCIPATKALISSALHRSKSTDSVGELGDNNHLYTNCDPTTRLYTMQNFSSTAKKHDSYSTAPEDAAPPYSDNGIYISGSLSTSRPSSQKRHSGMVHQMDPLEETRQRVQMFSNYVLETRAPVEPKYLNDTGVVGPTNDIQGEEQRRQAAKDRLLAASKQHRVFPSEDRLDIPDSKAQERETRWGSVGSVETTASSRSGGVILTTAEFEERERKESVKPEDPRLAKFKFDF